MAAAAGDPVTLQVVLTGAPDGSLSTAFIQRKSGVPVGHPLPALYASQQLLNAQPYVSGAHNFLHSTDQQFRHLPFMTRLSKLIEQEHVISHASACIDDVLLGVQAQPTLLIQQVSGCSSSRAAPQRAHCWCWATRLWKQCCRTPCSTSCRRPRLLSSTVPSA